MNRILIWRRSGNKQWSGEKRTEKEESAESRVKAEKTCCWKRQRRESVRVGANERCRGSTEESIKDRKKREIRKEGSD